MIIDTFDNLQSYAALHGLFPHVLEYLKTTNLLALPNGKNTILNDDMFVLIQRGIGQPKTDSKLECHRKYIDIQLVLDGTDEMGWKPLADCKAPIDAFNTANDVQFFSDLPLNWFVTSANKFCIFFPGDAHSGMISAHHLHKAVFKIAVNPTCK